MQQTEQQKPKNYRQKPKSWDRFYFAPEFWLTCAIILGFVWFLRYSSLTPDFLHNELAFQIYGTIATFIILIVTNALLERRNAMVAQGFEPLSYRLQQMFEKFGGLEVTLLITNLIMLWAVLYTHMWTPKGDFQHLYTGLEFAKTHPNIWVLPAINLLAVACTLFGRYFGRRAFLAVAALLAAAYTAAFITFVNITTNTAENSPEPNEIGFNLLIAAGLVAVIAPIVAVIVGFRKSPPEQLL